MKLLLILLFFPLYLAAQVPGGGVTDFDGNNYGTVIIGTQEWMSENLGSSHYANGDPIAQVTDPTQWTNLVTGAWAHYNNFSPYENPFGKLYNMYPQEVFIGNPHNVCPTDWHVPTDAEWTILTNYLGGLSVAGGKMKSTGTQYWLGNNTGATNESGFSGLPGGGRSDTGGFGSMGTAGVWWSSTETGSYNAFWCRSLYNQSSSADRSYYRKDSGLSVRCIKNSPVLATIELDPEQKKLSKIVDLQGREIQYQKNTILLYIYEDGTTERVFDFE